MGNSSAPVAESEELWGWKAIAARLKCSESQAERYAESHGLPVMKYGPGVKARIVAFADQVDRWKAEHKAKNLRPARTSSVPQSAAMTAAMSGGGDVSSMPGNRVDSRIANGTEQNT